MGRGPRFRPGFTPRKDEFLSNPNPVTLVSVKDSPPPGGQQEIIGRYYPSTVGEPVFKTVVPGYAPNFTSDEEPEDVETKVVSPARKRVGRPKSTEVAETKAPRKRAPRRAPAKVVDEE